jgi:uncharacterized protein YbjT (DUF2867 family)
MTDNKNEQTTPVLGGTGKTGRRVVQRLQARGVPVRIGTTSATPPFDWDDQATWAPALQEVAAVYVTYYLLGWADAVAEVAGATGCPIRYVPVSLEDYAAVLLDNLVPADYVKMLTEVFTEVLDGHSAWLGDGVQRALGRPPRDFRDFARDAAATGVWDR